MRKKKKKMSGHGKDSYSMHDFEWKNRTITCCNLTFCDTDRKATLLSSRVTVYLCEHAT